MENVIVMNEDDLDIQVDVHKGESEETRIPFKWTYMPEPTKIMIQELRKRYEVEVKKKISYELISNSCDICPSLQKIYNENLEQKDLLKDWLLVTINCKEENWLNCWEKIKIIKNWRWLKKALIAVEQRGEDINEIKLPHFHILIQEYDYISTKKLKKDYLYRNFLEYCGNEKHIDVRSVAYKYREDKLSYLQGRKFNEDKLQKQETDKLFRNKYDLKPYYSLTDLPTSNQSKHGGARKGAGRPKKRKEEDVISNFIKSEYNKIMEF